MNKNTKNSPTGFTLIEVMISVMIFSVVMTVALGALLAISESDKRAEALKSVVNNLDFALDAMTRAIRTGTAYDCGGTGSAHDCPAGATEFGFIPAGATQETYYEFDTNPADCGVQTTAGCIVRSIGSSGGPWSPLTSQEIDITALQFIVTGAQSAAIQPKVTILMSGTLVVSPTQSTTFHMQTSVTQRIYDQ